MAFLEGLDPLQRRGFTHPLFERIEPDNIDEGGDAFKLEVQFIPVLAVFFDGKGPEKTKRRPPEQGRIGHALQKELMLLQRSVQIIPQLLGQGKFAVQGPVIEQNGR